MTPGACLPQEADMPRKRPGHNPPRRTLPTVILNGTTIVIGGYNTANVRTVSSGELIQDGINHQRPVKVVEFSHKENAVLITADMMVPDCEM